MDSADSPVKIRASRDALRRRFDEELADLGDLKVSSWLMAQAPAPAALAFDGDRVPATEVDLDAALGALLWQAQAQLEQANSFHVIGPDGGLVAVYTPVTGALGIRPLVARDELADLSLHRRPIGANVTPPDYRPTCIAAVLWRFALFGVDGHAALPQHYRQLPLRLRQAPPLERDLVAGRHFKLMRLLRDSSRTFHELLDLTGLSDRQLGRDLAALQLVGSLVIA